VGKENIFKPTIGNDSLHQDTNDNDVRIENFAISKNPFVKSTMSHTETFINKPGLLQMGKLTTIFITHS
jgi:hypothetical protein